MGDNFSNTVQETELLAFRLGEQEYCIDIISVREIRGWTSATPLPFSPPHVKGVINLRGTVLPVIDLGVRLGLEAVAADDRNVIIVVSVHGQNAGLLVDAVSDILSIPTSELQPAPDLATDRASGCLKALALIEDRLIRVLQIGAVLPQRSAEVE